jgi:hypothetical protein
LAIVLLARSAAAAGEADEKAECIRASEQGQQLRDDGAYSRAAEAFARCSRDSCPALVKHDCAAWLVDLEGRAPSVVLGVTDANGADLRDVKVTMDGAPFATKLDGKPTRVDPGAHVFRYEAAGFVPVELRVVLRAGEKNRVLSVQFSAKAAASSSTDAANTEQSTASPAAPVGGAESAFEQPPLLAWILSGVALVAFASETYFGISGLNQRNDDLSPHGCAPHCSPSDVDSIRTKFAISDVSLGVGLVAAGAAAYFFLKPQPSRSATRAVLDVGLQQGGGLATVEGTF